MIHKYSLSLILEVNAFIRKMLDVSMYIQIMLLCTYVVPK
ncbi:hypothetical protein MHIR_DE00007 [Candidatus Doolittlea endobia]|uniref:Uncharacterized protein n=1 Tax=Candidatus Doolittlea endobia TaxID=1778262 RepID=A0A143WRD8_9ENTR|nr:hypothetical protein MHIR_DE00007 [Candidatus Doolittlea endobia]